MSELESNLEDKESEKVSNMETASHEAAKEFFKQLKQAHKKRLKTLSKGKLIDIILELSCETALIKQEIQLLKKESKND